MGGDFQLLVKKAGYFNEALKFEVHIFIGGQKFTIPSHSEKKAIFPNEKISFKWHPGMKVRLQLEQISWVNKILLDQEISEKVSLKALSRENSYKVDAAVAELLQNGEFHLSLSLQKMTPKDWQLFEDYIYPGNKW